MMNVDCTILLQILVLLRELRALSPIVAARRGRLEEEHWKEVLAELSCSLARGNGQILAAVRH